MLDRKKFPNYFLIIFGIYSMLLLLVLGPFFTILGMAADFILLFAIVLLPLALFVIYFHDDRIPALKEHETAMRIIITASAALVSSFLAVFVLPVI